MLGRIWEGTKVTLALLAMIAAALISANKLDHGRRDGARPVDVARQVPTEPAVTGSLGPR
ncbi:hypothetical protein [Methylobacterium radiodurans]|uniref:Uncharacterized protein n=1 Tax=Methylobacterium radiodurans TaxID=2202828 RepID=A0A2U8VYW8_9HYPH|nr:hypothetical protein [Methylobacterium radiodurans]AWN38965.1 hypothetical protein DK427_11615 [Methylobacterium radiodurans]